EVEGERNHPALLHEARRGDNILRRRIVERTDLVIRTPLAPVFVLFGGITHVLTIDLSGRHRMSSDEMELQREYSLWARAMQAPLATSSCNATMNKKGGNNGPTAAPRGGMHAVARRAIRRVCRTGSGHRGLSCSAGQDHRALRSGGPDRHDGALDRAKTERQPGQAVLCREPSGRGRQSWNGDGRERGTRRIHATARQLECCRQSESL